MSFRTTLVCTIAAALACVAIARPSQASSVVTIDFEAQANLELMTNQFAADHILFSNLIVLESFSTLNEFDFPPASGIHAVSGLAAGPAVIEFTRPARLFSAQLTTADVAEVTVFLNDGTTVSSLVAPNLGGGGIFSFSDGLIARITFAGQLSGDAFLLTLDDVVFAIPEPSAFLVMAVGLVPTAAAIRRRTRA